ncbi:hypothetical protein [Chamaesiphon sp.]|uniref:hypothetical protein n=1 Tax=Chamaesiphon sp. TaxID=2814140 RepID=UPI0035930786
MGFPANLTCMATASAIQTVQRFQSLPVLQSPPTRTNTNCVLTALATAIQIVVTRVRSLP